MHRHRRRAGCWLASTLVLVWISCGGGGDSSRQELRRLKSGGLEIVLLSPHDALRHGKDALTIEFHSQTDGALVDVGVVRATASMSMSGVPMFGSVDVSPTAVMGRYDASTDFSMAGTWRMTIEWQKPEPGSVSFSDTVQ